jgi:hypothetical protein
MLQRVIKSYLNRYALFESNIDKFNEKEKILFNQVKAVLLSNFYDTSNAHNIAILLKTDPNPEEDFVNKVFYYGKVLGQLDEPFVAQLFSPTYIYTQTEANSPYFWIKKNSSDTKGYIKPAFIPDNFIELWHQALKELNLTEEAVPKDMVKAIKRYSDLLSRRVEELEELFSQEDK